MGQKVWIDMWNLQITTPLEARGLVCWTILYQTVNLPACIQADTAKRSEDPSSYPHLTLQFSPCKLTTRLPPTRAYTTRCGEGGEVPS